MFEADAQIAHLCRLNLFDFAICNDQDIAVYGAERILFKLGYRGNKGCADSKKYAVNVGDLMDLSEWQGVLKKCGDDCTGETGTCDQCGCAVGL